LARAQYSATCIRKSIRSGVDANASKNKTLLERHVMLKMGGSLSIIATALTETGSKMDEVIFENLKVLVIWNSTA
jgi:transcription termination factor Rho